MLGLGNDPGAGGLVMKEEPPLPADTAQTAEISLRQMIPMPAPENSMRARYQGGLPTEGGAQ